MSNIYDFGWPSELVDIHFPRRENPNISFPWFWYLKRQRPYYFQYISPQAGGVGWQCTQNLPLIKILPIDPRQLVPTTTVGFGSLEEAITRSNSGEPISDDAWGRFVFGPKGGGIGRFFWAVIGTAIPEFTEQKGLLLQKPDHRGPDILPAVADAVTLWRTDWNLNAASTNTGYQGVSSDGTYSTIMGGGAFRIKVPRANIPLPELAATNGQWYFGPVPPTEVFETGQALFWKQAYAFTMEIAQLDSRKWDMSVFPPKDTTITDPTNPGFTERPPSSISGDYKGINPFFPAFPLNGPIIV